MVGKTNELARPKLGSKCGHAYRVHILHANVMGALASSRMAVPPYRICAFRELSNQFGLGTFIDRMDREDKRAKIRRIAKLQEFNAVLPRVDTGRNEHRVHVELDRDSVRNTVLQLLGSLRLQT